ncbi:MAG: carnitine dehydratase [Pseudomonadales bacterium]|nr:carnitine dehydratase [Pseudomonadales bacterium]
MHYNTSKRGVTLDLDEVADQEKFKTLIASADVLIESEATTRLASLKLDYDDLSTLNPKLIHIAVTPYGRSDPQSDLPVTDLTLMAAGGPPWNCGYDDHSLPPVRGWGNQAFHTGSHFAYMSALTALLHREISEQGQFIDVSITAALNVTTEAASYTHLLNGGEVQRQTGRHAAATRATGETQMQCADGRYVNTGVPPRFPVEFGRLHAWIRTLGLEPEFPEAVFLEMGAAWEGQFELSKIGEDDTITAIFSAGRDALKLIATKVSAYDFFIGCQNAGLAVGPINSPEEAFEDPHFVARGFQVPVQHEDLDRTIVYPGAPYKLPASPWQIAHRAPHLGEHNDEIFED